MSVSSFQAPQQSNADSQIERPSPRVRRSSPPSFAGHFSSRITEFEAPQRHAELFYLQKQIQSQTPMVIVLEDGERVEGCIEWYDRNSLKVRGRTKSLVYKAAIKYMHKLGDIG